MVRPYLRHDPHLKNEIKFFDNYKMKGGIEDLNELSSYIQNKVNQHDENNQAANNTRSNDLRKEF